MDNKAEELKQKAKVLNVRQSKYFYSFTEKELEQYAQQVSRDDMEKAFYAGEKSARRGTRYIPFTFDEWIKNQQ